MAPPQSQYRYPRCTATPAPGTLEELTDEQLELYEIPQQTRRVLSSARCLGDAVATGVDITAYVTDLVDESARLQSLHAEETRRIEDRVRRMNERDGIR